MKLMKFCPTKLKEQILISMAQQMAHNLVVLVREVVFQALIVVVFSSQGFSGFDDIFNIFSGFGSTTNSSAKSNRGEDIAIRIDLTLEEAALGINKKIDINRMEECKDCKGTGAKGGTEFYTCSSCGGSGKKNMFNKQFLDALQMLAIVKVAMAQVNKSKKNVLPAQVMAL